MGKASANDPPADVLNTPVHTPYNMPKLVGRRRREDDKHVPEGDGEEMHATADDVQAANAVNDGNGSSTVSEPLVDGAQKTGAKPGHTAVAEGYSNPLQESKDGAQGAGTNGGNEENPEHPSHKEIPEAASKDDLDEVQPVKPVPVNNGRKIRKSGQMSGRENTDAQKQKRKDAGVSERRAFRTLRQKRGNWRQTWQSLRRKD